MLGPSLQTRLSQQLVMTPQLQQAIKLLALSNLELETFLQAEIDKNPLLEGQAPEASADDPGAPEADAPDAAVEDGLADYEPPTADVLMVEGDAAADAPLDVDHTLETTTVADEGGGPTAGTSTGSDGGGAEAAGDIDALADTRLSLADHLVAQAGAVFSGTNLAVARYLIDHIDDAGYLRADPDEIAAALGVRPALVDRILKRIQCFDPSGVGARTLAECLTIQAREAGILDRPMARLLRNLDLLGRGEMTSLRRICQVDAAGLGLLIRALRRLDPKPGVAFGGEATFPVQPDVFVRRGHGGWQIELNPATLPRVLVNRTYHAELARGAKGGAKSFLTECLHSANWLVKALDQRARTIVTVATEIVRQQEGFFEHGVSRLRPLNLRSVATVVKLHESTVSRVTSNKYLMCERGQFELKYFFTPALPAATAGDPAISTETVKRRIHALIAAETPDDILSDDALVDRLRAEGFDVARRTVAKYREALHLGSSVQRRRRLIMCA